MEKAFGKKDKISISFAEVTLPAHFPHSLQFFPDTSFPRLQWNIWCLRHPQIPFANYLLGVILQHRDQWPWVSHVHVKETTTELQTKQQGRAPPPLYFQALRQQGMRKTFIKLRPWRALQRQRKTGVSLWCCHWPMVSGVRYCPNMCYVILLLPRDIAWQ